MEDPIVYFKLATPIEAKDGEDFQFIEVKPTRSPCGYSVRLLIMQGVTYMNYHLIYHRDRDDDYVVNYVLPNFIRQRGDTEDVLKQMEDVFRIYEEKYMIKQKVIIHEL